jgi:hypothetical protein
LSTEREGEKTIDEIFVQLLITKVSWTSAVFFDVVAVKYFNPSTILLGSLFMT